MWNYILIYRPLNIFFIGIAQILCAYFLDTSASLTQLYYGGLPWLILGTAACASFGYWINDYLDITIDVVNKKSGSRIAGINSYLVYVHLLLFISIAMWSGRMLGVWFLSLFIITLLALSIYSFWLKKQPLIGNLLIAALHFFSLYSVYKLFPQLDIILVLHFSILAAFVTLAREIVKDLEDVKGDQLNGANTLPVAIGLKGTNILAYTVLLFTLSFGFVSYYVQRDYFSGKLLWLYYAYAALFIVVPLFKIAIDVRFASGKAEYSRLSSWLKYVIFVGILSILFF